MERQISLSTRTTCHMKINNIVFHCVIYYAGVRLQNACKYAVT